MRQCEASDRLGRQHALVSVLQQVLTGAEQVGRVRQRVRQRRVVSCSGRCVIRHGGMHAGAHVQPATGGGGRVHIPPAAIHVVGFVRRDGVERPVVWMTRVHRADFDLA